MNLPFSLSSSSSSLSVFLTIFSLLIYTGRKMIFKLSIFKITKRRNGIIWDSAKTSDSHFWSQSTKWLSKDRPGPIDVKDKLVPVVPSRCPSVPFQHWIQCCFVGIANEQGFNDEGSGNVSSEIMCS